MFRGGSGSQSTTMCIIFGADWWPRSAECVMSVDGGCDGVMLATTVNLEISSVCSILPLSSSTVLV